MSPNPPQSHPRACTISIRNVPDTGATDRHDPRRSQLFTTFVRIPAWKHDPKTSEFILQDARANRVSRYLIEIVARGWDDSYVPLPMFDLSTRVSIITFPLTDQIFDFQLVVELCVRYTCRFMFGIKFEMWIYISLVDY